MIDAAAAAAAAAADDDDDDDHKGLIKHVCPFLWWWQVLEQI